MFFVVSYVWQHGNQNSKLMVLQKNSELNGPVSLEEVKEKY